MRRREERGPPAGAGLIRYFSEEGEGIKISPKLVAYFTVGFILFEILLRFVGKGLLGF
jgi:preprotein translocase subunit Sec61beta